MLSFTHKGNFNNTEKFFKRSQSKNYISILEKYGQDGVKVLASATPVDTGKTAESWGYKIVFTKRGTSIVWTNSNIVNGAPIAILLQYGHGTRNGGFVQGRDYINPALRPIFDKLADELWKEVNR